MLKPSQLVAVVDELGDRQPDPEQFHFEDIQRIDGDSRAVASFDPLRQGISGVLRALDLIRLGEGNR